MREIKFRGRSSIGSWHYGNLTTTSYEDKGQLKYVYAISGINDKSYCSGIEGKTVGQFIGLKDKNGDEIYEGDIMECYRSGQSIRGQVVIEDGCSFIKFNNNSKAWVHEAIKKFKAIVIGNVVDDPELEGK